MELVTVNGVEDIPIRKVAPYEFAGARCWFFHREPSLVVVFVNLRVFGDVTLEVWFKVERH